MSKKKDNEKFNNPFSALKGLSVSSQEKVVKKTEPVQPEPPKPELNKEAESSDADFFAEMAGLGVRVIEQSGREKQTPLRDEDSVAEPVSGKEKTSPATGSGVAQARRDKQLKRGDIQPQAELDLHGFKASEVLQKVAWFLENSRFYGFEAVRIITGKGSHSGEGPILRPLVEEYLNGPGRTFVVEWLRAPQKQGGEGAIIAFLRQE
jgi:DNA-nicking Smr family endonuclease